MSWTPLPFGKHKGKTLPQVIFTDPDWFYWAIENQVFDGTLIWEAEEAEKKSKSIKIPRGGRVAIYVCDDMDRFDHLEIVPKSRDENWCGPPMICEYVIDLSTPRRMKQYDKTGYTILIRQVKGILFGRSDHRMTRRRCEDFFNDDSNFILDCRPNSLFR